MAVPIDALELDVTDSERATQVVSLIEAQVGLFERFSERRHRYPSGDSMRDVVEFVSTTNPNLDTDAVLNISLDDVYEEFLIGTPSEGIEKVDAYRCSVSRRSSARSWTSPR